MLQREREYARMEGVLLCPKCYNAMEGDCPNEPWWIEYTCEECGYKMGTTWPGDESMVIDEGNLHQQEEEE